MAELGGPTVRTGCAAGARARSPRTWNRIGIFAGTCPRLEATGAMPHSSSLPTPLALSPVPPLDSGSYTGQTPQKLPDSAGDFPFVLSVFLSSLEELLQPRQRPHWAALWNLSVCERALGCQGPAFYFQHFISGLLREPLNTRQVLGS